MRPHVAPGMQETRPPTEAPPPRVKGTAMKGEAHQNGARNRWETFNKFRFDTEAAAGVWL